MKSFAEKAAVCLILALAGAPALDGQEMSSEALRPETFRSEAALRLGVTALGVDTERGPSAAVELTYVGAASRLWRAGFIGGLITSFDGVVYGYGGLHLPISLPIGLLARPSFAVGLYEKGDGTELGGVLEFRSSLVLERALGERIRISAMLYHLSNAGLGFKNPGMEAVGVAVAIPLSGGS